MALVYEYLVTQYSSPSQTTLSRDDSPVKETQIIDRKYYEYM